MYPLLQYSLEDDPFVPGTDFFPCVSFCCPQGFLLLLRSASTDEPDVSPGVHSVNNNNKYQNNLKNIELSCLYPLLFS